MHLGGASSFRMISVSTRSFLFPVFSNTLAKVLIPINQLEIAVSTTTPALIDALTNGILFLKRTFQPSVIRRRRKHGFLTRNRNRNGRKIIKRRIAKKRRYVYC